VDNNSTIYSTRFTLQALTKQDASELYLSWLQDKATAQFISFLQEDVIALSQYIEQQNNDEHCWFWGVFHQGKHIGNIKYQRLHSHPNVATMGILIGEKCWQGRGVAAEVWTT
jgi:ribosomal-protein-alanine N-acetyltransferase